MLNYLASYISSKRKGKKQKYGKWSEVNIFQNSRIVAHLHVNMYVELVVAVSFKAHINLTILIVISDLF